MTYTPTDDEVRRSWSLMDEFTCRNAPEAFDRWLAAHDTQVAAQAVADAAEEIAPWNEGTATWLRSIASTWEGFADRPSPHPDWAAVGSTVRVTRTGRAPAGRAERSETDAIVTRHTPTVIILDNGQRFRRNSSSSNYQVTPHEIWFSTEITEVPL